VQLATPEDNPLRVETCNATQINKKKIVALTAEFVLLVVLTQQVANNNNNTPCNLVGEYLRGGGSTLNMETV
jgi:hypothetical protein